MSHAASSRSQRLRRWLGFSLGCALIASLTAHANERDQILAKASPAEWQTLPADELMYLDLPKGHVVIRLAPRMSPAHIANLRQLIKQHYFDGLAIVRVQDNFVAQWDDPASDDGGDPRQRHSLGAAQTKVAPEFTRPIQPDDRWTPLADGDLYAPEVGFLDGFPAARDPQHGREWLVHCYAMVGVGRDVAIDSGNGSALYAVIGQPPRRLDHNLAVIGRVISGIEYLSALPRGNGPLGFYQQAAQRTPIVQIRLGSMMANTQHTSWQQLRTDSASFARLLQAQRQQRSDFYPEPTGRVDVCNAELPVRQLQINIPSTEKAPH